MHVTDAVSYSPGSGKTVVKTNSQYMFFNRVRVGTGAAHYNLQRMLVSKLFTHAGCSTCGSPPEWTSLLNLPPCIPTSMWSVLKLSMSRVLPIRCTAILTCCPLLQRDMNVWQCITLMCVSPTACLNTEAVTSRVTHYKRANAIAVNVLNQECLRFFRVIYREVNETVLLVIKVCIAHRRIGYEIIREPML